jgi:alpha-tubulin suppressor-like RCC1 family protein
VLPLPDGGAALPRPAADVFVSVGSDHTCALVGGKAYCWGNNDAGQLGTGDQGVRLSPTEVPGDLTFTALSVGYGYSCALDDAGRVHCWGDNGRGQLGTGDRDARFEPTIVALPLRAVSLAARFERSCAITSDASLYCWGDNAEGGAGQGGVYVSDDPESADELLPVRVPLDGVRAVGVGQGHTCAVLLDGSLQCWGRNSRRELGAGDQIQHRSPIAVGGAVDWLSLALGQQHSCALASDDSLWCWGANTAVDNQEGAPLAILGATQLDEPTRVGTDSDWLVVSTDTFHTCVIDRSEHLFCAGRNAEGQLGIPGSDFVPELTRVEGNFARVSAGRFSSCAVTSEGVVVCAGENDSGQLGSLDTERRGQFTPVE